MILQKKIEINERDSKREFDKGKVREKRGRATYISFKIDGREKKMIFPFLIIANMP